MFDPAIPKLRLLHAGRTIAPHSIASHLQLSPTDEVYELLKPDDDGASVTKSHRADVKD